MNILCGANGVGKTTILECVAHAFVQQASSVLKRKAGSEKGGIEVSLTGVDGNAKLASITVAEFGPSASPSWYGGLHDESEFLLSLKVVRGFEYQSLVSITKDVDRSKYRSSADAASGVNVSEVKGWLVNRIVYSGLSGSLSDEQLYNLNLTKKFFSILDEKYQYSRVVGATNDVMLDTPTGEIYYEYLSSGFRACLALLLGIAKEIEFRFKHPDVKFDEFEGVILIDEVELHLHPEWQAKVPGILKTAFPKAQFILTTHSPHVIQAAKAEEVIALQQNGDSVEKRQLYHSEFGFQGWTVEEILNDVMGMSDTRTPAYHDASDDFDKAVDEGDYDSAKKAFETLNGLLHPENHMRKLLAFQLGSLKE